MTPQMVLALDQAAHTRPEDAPRYNQRKHPETAALEACLEPRAMSTLIIGRNSGLKLGKIENVVRFLDTWYTYNCPEEVQFCSEYKLGRAINRHTELSARTKAVAGTMVWYEE